jgi:putative peptidoglycan lipid II flippase
MGLATSMSRVLGLVREQAIAFVFGVGNATDAFLVAFRLPNLFRDLFAEGAMNSALVPTLTNEKSKGGDEKAWLLVSQVMNWIFLITGFIACLGIYFAPELVSVFAGSYKEVPGKYELTVFLTRLAFPFFPLVSLAAVAMGSLHVYRRFFLPALAPASFNIWMIISCFTLVQWVSYSFDWPPIAGLVLGVLLGGASQFFVQLPVLIKLGFRWKPSLGVKSKALQQVFYMMTPGLVGMAAVQVNILVNTFYATGAGTGSVTWLQYAFRLVQFPIGVFGISIAQASLARVSYHISDEDLSGAKDQIQRSLKLLALINLPAACGLIVLAEPIVSLIFERGAFTAADTIQTARALQAYSAGLLFYTAVKVCVPVFYALKNARVPVVSSVLSVVLNIILGYILVRAYGHVGLAAGTSAMMGLNFMYLFLALRKRFTGVFDKNVLRFLSKILVACALMSLASYGLEKTLEFYLFEWLALVLTIFLSAFLFFFLLWSFRVSEIDELRPFLARFTRPFRKG